VFSVTTQQISKASTISRYDEIARRANIYAECQQFDSVCDLEHDMGKEVGLILAKCRHAEDEVYPPTRTVPFPKVLVLPATRITSTPLSMTLQAHLGKGDTECFFKKCFDPCGSDGSQVCTVNHISAHFECGKSSSRKEWASKLVHIEAKCCGEVAGPHYLTEVGHPFLPMCLSSGQCSSHFLPETNFAGTCPFSFCRLDQRLLCQFCLT
jgi:hypothetical protein